MALIWAAMIFLSPESCESTESPECNATTDEFDCNSKESPVLTLFNPLMATGVEALFTIGLGVTALTHGVKPSITMGFNPTPKTYDHYHPREHLVFPHYQYLPLGVE